MAPSEGQGVHSSGNQGGLPGGGKKGAVRGRERISSEKFLALGGHVAADWIFTLYILSRIMLPRACLVWVLHGPSRQPRGQGSLIDVSCVDEEVQDQRGSGAFLRLHSEEGLSWSQTPSHTPSPSQPLLPMEQQMLLLGAQLLWHLAAAWAHWQGSWK